MFSSEPHSSHAAFESLESRTFLSASPVVAPAHHTLFAATKVKATIPSVAGMTYSGTATSNAGGTVGASLSFSTETKSGVFHGTLDVLGNTYRIAGTVNAKDKVIMRGTAGRLGLNITSALSSDLATITGKYIATGAKKNGHGTFSLTRILAP